jgi:hypothetical protein
LPLPEIKVGIHDPAALGAMKSFYVALDESSQSKDEDDDKALNAVQQALAARGLVATGGPLSAMPGSTDCKVIVRPHWFWDMGKYLLRLEVELSDNKTGKNVGYAGSWRGAPRLRRTPEFMAKELIEAIYRSPGML